VRRPHWTVSWTFAGSIRLSASHGLIAILKMLRASVPCFANVTRHRHGRWHTTLKGAVVPIYIFRIDDVKGVATDSFGNSLDIHSLESPVLPGMVPPLDLKIDSRGDGTLVVRGLKGIPVNALWVQARVWAGPIEEFANAPLGCTHIGCPSGGIVILT